MLLDHEGQFFEQTPAIQWAHTSPGGAFETGMRRFHRAVDVLDGRRSEFGNLVFRGRIEDRDGLARAGFDPLAVDVEIGAGQARSLVHCIHVCVPPVFPAAWRRFSLTSSCRCQKTPLSLNDPQIGRDFQYNCMLLLMPERYRTA